VARVCDHLVVLSGGRVRQAGGVPELLAAHRWVTGPHGRTVARSATGDPVGVEDLILSYLEAAR
jgi:hypothetical protein